MGNETKRTLLYGGAELMTPDELLAALRGHIVRGCQCSGCVMQRDRKAGEK